MTADFNWFLNKQGPRGQQGVKGEQGFSPVITVAENTAKAYILRIQTQDDTFLTPNLRGTVEDLGGTYVRYNPETGQVYAGSPDVATTETYGVIRLATQQDVTNLAQDAAVTPELLANQIEALDLSNDYVTINTPQNINASKTFTNGISLSSIHNSDGAEVLNFVSGEPFKFKTLNNGLNVEGGTLRVTDGSIKSKSTKQPSTDANVYDVVTSFDLATTENAGIVKPDGSTIFIGENGVISAKSGAIDDSNTSTQSTWSSSKINTEISTVAQEVVGIQGDVASLNADVSTLKPTVESHTTSIGAINDSIAIAMSDITELKSGKQDKLTAGNNITIEGNVISATGSAGGSGLEICDISMALYVDETKGLRRYLNGQIVDINTNTQAFLNRLKEITTLHPSLLCTEEEWQTAKTMSAFGQVGKFVFNYSGADIVSVRIPRVVNVQGLFDLQNLGMTVAESLPNITGTVGNFNKGFSDNSGCFTGFKNKGNSAGGTYSGGGNVASFNASGSSSTYQDNAPVQQEAIQYPYFIQIATGSETEANIINTLENVNGFTLLESKYSDKPLYNESWLLSNGQWNAKTVYPTVYEGLQVEYNTEIEVGTTVTLPSGVSYTKRGLSVKLSTETYTDYDFVLNTADETFRLPLKTLHSDDTVDSLSLYYYVGETVQNANLIDAGRIGEILPTKTDMLQASGAGMPSNKYIDLTLGASGSTYTAPANGWFACYKGNLTTAGYLYMRNNANQLVMETRSTLKGTAVSAYMPVQKGQSILVNYDAVGTLTLFRFIYSKGAQ